MNLKDDSKPVGISVARWVDARGKTAKVDPNTPIAFTSSDENLVVIGVSAAGNPAILPGPLDGVDADPDTGVIGAPVLITATADADLGDGVQSVTAVGSVTVIAGSAATGEIVFGQPDA